ncbi:hypothetical protein U8527_18620 [Kordia algicida OT-1]|uniref:Uncharacterized protein n=1 Tax=Kordia algicida OT-1 TaxID=391587 RepID=A9DJ22_9FLAO|nr:hypothetical protein [Kordia algicida]EDP98012.1 hypothetical protein KAOT1_12382 [Kordia algicida OT-1]
MSREFDSFIIVPEFAEKPLKAYDEYIGANVEDNPEMALIRFKGIIASFIHDATEKEEKTIEYFEKPNTGLRSNFQKALKSIHKDLVINSNVFLDTISILPEENENYHLAKITFVTNNKDILIYSYGSKVTTVNK